MASPVHLDNRDEELRNFSGSAKMREELTHLLQERQSVLSAFGTASEKAMHRPPHAIRKG